MNYWKVILATVMIFGAGVMTGGLLVNYVNHHHPRFTHRSPAGTAAATDKPVSIPPPRLAERIGRQFVQQLNETLQLTPEQRKKIGKIIADGQGRNHEIWTNVAPKIRAVIQDVNHQIRAELTPAQVVQFEELLKHPPRRAATGTNAAPVLHPPHPTDH